MQAAVLHELGKPPRCEDLPEPSAGKEEATIQVRAASLKAVDKQLDSPTPADYARKQSLVRRPAALQFARPASR